MTALTDDAHQHLAQPDHLGALAEVIRNVIEPQAARIDRESIPAHRATSLARDSECC